MLKSKAGRSWINLSHYHVAHYKYHTAWLVTNPDLLQRQTCSQLSETYYLLTHSMEQSPS